MAATTAARRKLKRHSGQTVYYHVYRARQTVALRYRKVVATAHPYLAERIEYFARRRCITHRTFGTFSSQEEYTQGSLSF